MVWSCGFSDAIARRPLSTLATSTNPANIDEITPQARALSNKTSVPRKLIAREGPRPGVLASNIEGRRCTLESTYFTLIDT
jgi:hypothetical protein